MSQSLKCAEKTHFSKIEALLKTGADANHSCLDVFLNTTPTAYADITQFRTGASPDATSLDIPSGNSKNSKKVGDRNENVEGINERGFRKADTDAYGEEENEYKFDDTIAAAADDADDDEGYSSNGYTRFYDPYHEMYYYADEALSEIRLMKPTFLSILKNRKSAHH